MIIGYLRSRVSIYMSALLLILAMTLAVDASPQSSPALTWPEISLAIWLRYGAAVGTSIAATWVLLAGYERRQDTRHTETMKALAAASEGLRLHNEDRGAHLQASEHNHGPMNAQSDRIEEKIEKIGMALHDLIRDHNRIQEQEGVICSALSAIKMRRADIPAAEKRASDPEDYAPGAVRLDD